jgi:predicted phage tail component-like protein
MASLTPIVVKFGGNDFNQVPGLLVSRRSDLEPADRVMNQYKLARTNKSVITTAEFSSKTVVIEGYISRPNRFLLRDSLDLFNSVLAEIEAPLIIMQDGMARKYTATMKALKIAEQQGGYAKFGITFICSDPFGYDIAPTQLLNSVVSTSGNISFQLAIGGSAQVEPNFTVILTDVTDGIGKTVQLYNTLTGIGISIKRDWAEGGGDVIEVNGDEGKVRINGAEVNPVGKIPAFVPGLRQVGYLDDFTDRAFEISGNYTKRYL